MAMTYKHSKLLGTMNNRINDPSILNSILLAEALTFISCSLNKANGRVA